MAFACLFLLVRWKWRRAWLCFPACTGCGEILLLYSRGVSRKMSWSVRLSNPRCARGRTSLHANELRYKSNKKYIKLYKRNAQGEKRSRHGRYIRWWFNFFGYLICVFCYFYSGCIGKSTDAQKNHNLIIFKNVYICLNSTLMMII